MKKALVLLVKFGVTLGIFVGIFLEFGGGYAAVEAPRCVSRARSKSPTRRIPASSAASRRRLSRHRRCRRPAARHPRGRLHATPPRARSSCARPTARCAASSRCATAAKRRSPRSTCRSGRRVRTVAARRRARGRVRAPAGLPARAGRALRPVGRDPQRASSRCSCRGSSPRWRSSWSASSPTSGAGRSCCRARAST